MTKELLMYLLISPLILASLVVVMPIVIYGVIQELRGHHEGYVWSMTTVDKIWFFFKKPGT